MRLDPFKPRPGVPPTPPEWLKTCLAIPQTGSEPLKTRPGNPQARFERFRSYLGAPLPPAGRSGRSLGVTQKAPPRKTQQRGHTPGRSNGHAATDAPDHQAARFALFKALDQRERRITHKGHLFTREPRHTAQGHQYFGVFRENEDGAQD